MITKNNKSKKIFFKENYIIKRFNKNQLDISNQEIKGHTYFKNKKIFRLIKRLKIIKKKNHVEIIYKRYFKIRQNSFFKLNKFYKIKNLKLEIADLHTYRKKLLREYMFIKKKYLYKNIVNFFNKLKNKKIFLAASHGDFVHYNTFISKNNFYTIDFEFFNKKRVFNYDLYNWYFTPLLTNIIRYKVNFFSNYIIDIYFFFLKICNFGYDYPIKKYFFKKVFLYFYFIEKLIFFDDVKKYQINKKDFSIIHELEKIIIKKLKSI